MKKFTILTILLLFLFSVTGMAQMFLDPNIAVRRVATIVDVYSAGSTIDDNALADQKNVPVAATANFTGGDRVIIGRGTDREEEFVIDSVDTGVKIVSLTNLDYNHTIDADTTVDALNAEDGDSVEFLDEDDWTDDDWDGDFAGGWAHIVGTVEVIELADGGSGYTPTDVITLVQSGGSECTLTVLTVDDQASDAILTFEVTTKGAGYSVEDGLATTMEEGGTGATFNVLEVSNETPLSHIHTPTVGARYIVSITVATRTDGNFSASFGGLTVEGIEETTAYIMYALNTNPVVITPHKQFDGTVSISIEEITKVLTVTATTGFVAGETVIVNEGEDDEETYVIASIQAGTSLTMTESLKRDHEADETVNQYGVGGIVEICWAAQSDVIYKAHYKDIVLFLPSTWTTAEITFLGSDTYDGTYNQVVVADDVGELTIASVAASKVIVMNGEIRDALSAIPFLKLRSGTSASEVDQGAGVEIPYVLMR